MIDFELRNFANMIQYDSFYMTTNKLQSYNGIMLSSSSTDTSYLDINLSMCIDQNEIN